VTVELQLKHFKTVQTAYVEFGTYMGDVRGTKGDRRAYDHGLRAKQEDTPYHIPPSRLSARADEMRRNGQQPSVFQASHQSAHNDPYSLPANQRQATGMGFNTGSNHGYSYSQGQPLRPVGNLGARTYESQQVYEIAGGQQNRSDPRLYNQTVQQEPPNIYSTLDQTWETPSIHFRPNPSSQPAQISGLYRQGPQQYDPADPQGTPYAHAGPGAGNIAETINIGGLHGGPSFGDGHGVGVPLR
jgi:hypothetical protein